MTRNRAPAKKLPPQEWTSLSDDELLKLRLCDLDLRVEETDITKRASQLYSDLEARGLKYRPTLYFGDEWFSPEGMNAIAVPFYLAHPRLKALEKNQMMEIEGGDPIQFMRLLRHEAGHCFDHCYRFSRRPAWRKIFGPPETEYHPESYRPRPYSRSFVQNLEKWYAQSHPDEDFAETFAVWADPSRDWKNEYQEWPAALEKLEYLGQLAKESPRLKNRSEGGRLPFDARKITTTLAKIYARRRKEHEDEYPDTFDNDIKAIFDGPKELSRREYSAGKFLHRHRKEIVSSLARWSGERKVTIDQLVKRITTRSEALDLRIGKTESLTTLEVASFLSTLISNYLFTGRFKRKR